MARWQYFNYELRITNYDVIRESKESAVKGNRERDGKGRPTGSPVHLRQLAILSLLILLVIIVTAFKTYSSSGFLWSSQQLFQGFENQLDIFTVFYYLFFKLFQL